MAAASDFNPTASNAAAVPAATTDILDPRLIPTLLGRIDSIVDKLRQAAQSSDSLAKSKTSGQKQGSGDKKDNHDELQRTDQANNAQDVGQTAATGSDSMGASIALGGVSDDDHSLYDFLFSSAGNLSSSSSATGGHPTELSLNLLKEARELRDTYRRALAAARVMPAAKWALNEQRQAIQELKEMQRVEISSAHYTSSSPGTLAKRKAETEEKVKQESKLNGKAVQSQTDYYPLGALLELHLTLSSQIAHALFTSIQSAYSTALPPAPIVRPERLPERLSSLAIWREKSQPTPTALIPSLMTVHDSLDGLLLKARTHRANARRIEALKREVKKLRKARVDRIKSLRDASSELRGILVESKIEISKIKRARTAPLAFTDVLAYAADLARVTSAPPGWVDGVVKAAGESALRDKVEAALKEQRSGDQDDGVAQDSVAADNVETPGEGEGGQKEAKGALAAPDETGQGEVREDQTQPETRAQASSSFLLHALRQQQGQGEDNQALASSSAPHSLPFPSDADMRRGLMGVAMMADMGHQQQQQQQQQQVGLATAHSHAMKDLLPSWNTFCQAKKAGEEGAAMIAAQEEAEAEAQKQERASRNQSIYPDRGQASLRSGEPAQEDAGFGLDL